MKQQSRNRDDFQQEEAGSDSNNKKDSSAPPMKKSSGNNSGQAPMAANTDSLNDSESTATEVTRTAEGRPGSYGIDDF